MNKHTYTKDTWDTTQLHRSTPRNKKKSKENLLDICIPVARFLRRRSHWKKPMMVAVRRKPRQAPSHQGFEVSRKRRRHRRERKQRARTLARDAPHTILALDLSSSSKARLQRVAKSTYMSTATPSPLHPKAASS